MISFTSCFSSSVVSECLGGEDIDNGTVAVEMWFVVRLFSSFVLLDSEDCHLFLSTIVSELLLWSSNELFTAFRLWLLAGLFSTVAQNFLNFLCRYLESFEEVGVNVICDCETIEVAVDCWSFRFFDEVSFVPFEASLAAFDIK